MAPPKPAPSRCGAPPPLSIFNAVKDSLQRGQLTLDVALAAGSSFADEGKGACGVRYHPRYGRPFALPEDFRALRDQLAKTGGSTLAALAKAAGTSKIMVSVQPLGLGVPTGAVIVSTALLFAASAGAAQAIIATVNTAICEVSNALAKMGNGSKALDLHLPFILKLQDILDNGVGNLVGADLVPQTSKLQSLQAKQQLGVQALSIANQCTPALPGLFR